MSLSPNSLVGKVLGIETSRSWSFVSKTQARPADLSLRVNGVSSTLEGMRVYRMVTRDGHYVGRTNPTKVRARKGDVLKIQANDFLQDTLGDIKWGNPNVVSQGTDAAHSWRELQALAGDYMLEKDTADGPAGDIPAAGDEGDFSDSMEAAAAVAATEGPTLSDVHVDVPLKNISVGYMNRKFRLNVSKADQHRQLLYGVVLEPNVLDSQDDFMLPHHVEQAAHTYMKKVVRGKASVTKLQHRAKGFFKEKPSVVPVESFIAPVDFTYDGKEMVRKGTWVMVIHVEDPAVWRDVLDGKYTGLSIGGTGIRQEMSVPDDVVPHGYISPPSSNDWFKTDGSLR